MKVLKIVGSVILFFTILIGLSYAFGWNKVFYTKTVGKAQQNAEREVYEETQSRVDGMRQNALKYYGEYQRAKDEETKRGIKNLVKMSFAEFDEDKYFSGELKNFVHNCKYNP
jgi:hypothetical protein